MEATYDAEWVASFAIGLATSGLEVDVCLAELSSVINHDRTLMTRALRLVCLEPGCTASVCDRARSLIAATAEGMPT